MTTTKQKLGTLYLLTFLFSLHGALPLYINSSFLGTLIPEGLIGFVYTLASLLAIIALIWIPDVLSLLGNYRITFLLLFFQLGITTLLAFSGSPLLGVILLILNLVLFRLVGYNVDLFTEHFSTDATTGGIRGVFLTIGNVAILVAPTLAGFIVDDNNFFRLYISSALFLIPVLYLLNKRFSTFKDPIYERFLFWRTIKKTYKRKNVRHIMFINFLLRFFYAWMVIYMPIYLNQVIGFSWGQIGGIFSIMLLPFVLFELPLGKLADTKYGEKEILTTGFLVLSIATGALAFLTTTSFIIWASALFLTRTGASMVEIMMESYFFKHIDGSDSPTLSLFRIMQPAAYVIAPLAASISFYLVPFNFLFLILSIITLYGIRHGLALVDTR
jgi:MFS family permease